jgi:uncharacterized protein
VKIWEDTTDAYIIESLHDDLSRYLGRPADLVRKGPTIRGTATKQPEFMSKLKPFQLDYSDVSQPGAGDGTRVDFADGYPLLLATNASVDVIQKMARDPSTGVGMGGWNAEKWGLTGKESDFTIRRFRPNIVIDGAEAWEEDGWLTLDWKGKGSGRLWVMNRCGRCQVSFSAQSISVMS